MKKLDMGHYYTKKCPKSHFNMPHNFFIVANKYSSLKAPAPRISCYKVVDIFWPKVVYIYVDRVTKFPDRSEKNSREAP